MSRIEIDRPVESVFAFVADLRNHERMLPSTYSGFTLATPNHTGVGARLDYTIGLMGREYPAMTEISVYQPPGRLVERANPSGSYWSEWLFEPAGSGTRVTMRTVYQPGGGLIGRILDPIVGQRRNRENQQRQLERLKAAVEGGDAGGAP